LNSPLKKNEVFAVQNISLLRLRNSDWPGSSVVLAALCVSYLVKTCKHILSCTEDDFVVEKEAYNATQASRFSKIHGPLSIYSSKLEVPIQVGSRVSLSRQ